MTKNRKKIVTSKDQLSLFDLLRQEQAERQSSRSGRLNISVHIHAAIINAISTVRKSRETIADDMTDLLGEKITCSMINNWTAESHPHEMPGRYYSAFCIATDDLELLRIQAEAAGLFTVKGPDALRADVKKEQETRKEIDRRIRQKEALIKELEGK